MDSPCPGNAPAATSAFKDALAEAEVAAALRRFGQRPVPLSPEILAERVVADHAATGLALRRLSIV